MKSKNKKKVNIKECQQLFCHKEAKKKIKFKKHPFYDLDKEIQCFCKEHAKQKLENDDIRDMWVAPI